MPVTNEPVLIDTAMLGHAGITAAYVLRGEATTLVETGPKSTVGHVLEGLERAGVEDLDFIVVTHVHLDHAGAAGTLAHRFPDAVVAVHEIGAPHLVDPGKLWSSAARIYGDAMEDMWGGIDAVPANRIRTLTDGDRIELGGLALRAVATPGHASHHHAFLEEGSGTVYCGDALGVRLPDMGVLRPATPPPEFDLEQAIASIERIRALGAESLSLTHFGSTASGVNSLGVDHACEQAIEALRRWAEWVSAARATTSELDEATVQVEKAARSALESSLDDIQVERLERTTTYRMNTWGYMRYLDKEEGG
ncbi:MBL fold metallo-hydrolase [soil metagenome]